MQRRFGALSLRHHASMGQPVSSRADRLLQPRLAREVETIEAMLHVWCRAHHATGPSLCPDCAALLDYARKRLAGCPYGGEKPTCTNCQIHCYGPAQREQVRVVMRYAGPRMLLRHPYLALMHVLDGKRPAPPKPRGRAAS